MHHKLNGFITASEYAWFHQCAKSALSEFECHVGIQMPGVIRFPIFRLLFQLANSIFLVWVDALVSLHGFTNVPNLFVY